MTAYFLDTGFLIALEAADDQHHAAAIAAWREIRKRSKTALAFDKHFTQAGFERLP